MISITVALSKHNISQEVLSFCQDQTCISLIITSERERVFGMLVWWCYKDYRCSYESLYPTKGVLRWAFKSPLRQPVSVTLLLLTPTHTALFPLWGRDAKHANPNSDTSPSRKEVYFSGLNSYLIKAEMGTKRERKWKKCPNACDD